jgi:nucleotide-binding universal stress UspA family protein
MVGQVTGIYREMDEIGAQLADDRADEGAAIARRAGFDAQALTAQGKPWVEILRVAEDHNVMAIVLGGGPRAGVGSALIGGVPARVASHHPGELNRRA